MGTGRGRLFIPLIVAVAAACAPAPSTPSASPFAASTALGTASPTALSLVTVAPAPTAAASAAPSATATLAPSPTPTPAPTVSTAALQRVLDEMRHAYGSIGGLAVVADGDTRKMASSGIADRRGAKITSATRFRIASITKPIVATLLLQAVGEGKVHLDDVVGSLVPGLLRATPPITVRQLLNHTSGIFDEEFFGNPTADAPKLANSALRTEAQAILARYRAGERVILPARIIVAMAETHPRYFAPGAGYHYDNTGYVLATMVLEKVTGQSLADLLRTRIVEPLGLHRTTIAPPDLGSPEFHGYMPGASGQVDVTNRLFLFANGGSCGVITTADELLAIMQAVVTGRLLRADLAAEMKTVYRDNYGLGLETYPSTFACGTFWGHTGGVNGTVSVVAISADGVRGAVLAVNVWSSRTDPHAEKYAASVLCPG